jgi:hypothetical protein
MWRQFLEKVGRSPRHPFVVGLGLVGVLVVQCIAFQGSWDSWDLRLWDGSWYWGWGRDAIMHLRFSTFENAPFYCAYYGLFHLVSDDPYTIFYLHRFGALLLITSLAYFLFVRLFSPFVACLLVLYSILLVGDGGVSEYTVRFFVVIPFLLAAHAALTRGPWTAPLMLLAFLGAVLTRPEMSLGFLVLLVLLWGWTRWREPTNEWSSRALWGTRAVWLVGAAISILLLVHMLRSNRSWLAFGQHYSVGYQMRHPEHKQNPWVHWKAYLKRSFGSAKRVGQALKANPKAFAAHVSWNLTLLPKSLDLALKPVVPIQTPWVAWVRKQVSFLYVWIALVLVLAWWVWKSPDSEPSRLLSSPHLGLLLLGILVPIGVSSLVIYPSVHFMYGLKFAALLPVGLLLQRVVERYTSWEWMRWVLVLMFVVCLFFFPEPFLHRPAPVVRPVVKAWPTFASTRAYGVVADSAISFCRYAKTTKCTPHELLWLEKQPTNIKHYLQDKNARVILVSRRLLRNLQPVWKRFIYLLMRNPKAFGFRQHFRSGSYAMYVKDTDWARR